MHSMFVLNVRTMHSSALRALECIAWGRSSTGDSETGDAETGDIKTSERERERLVMKCTFSTIVSCNLSTSIFGIGKVT